MPASEGGRVRSRVHASVATLKTWWMAYLNRRIERVAIVQLEAMSDRELEDIGLTRSQIEWAVMGPALRDCTSIMARTPCGSLPRATLGACIAVASGPQEKTIRRDRTRR